MRGLGCKTFCWGRKLLLRHFASLPRKSKSLADESVHIFDSQLVRNMKYSYPVRIRVKELPKKLLSKNAPSACGEIFSTCSDKTFCKFQEFRTAL
jgi:hypothetical protein